MAVTINGTTGIESPALDASGTVTADAVVIDALGGTLSFTGGGTTAINAQSSPLIFQTSGTERGRFTGGGDFQFNSGYGSVATAYGCRAWVHFVGSGGSRSGSGNVSSVTVDGTGLYSVNFSTSMPDANYTVIGTGERANGVSAIVTITDSGTTIGSLTTAGFGVRTTNESSQSRDFTKVFMMVMR